MEIILLRHGKPDVELTGYFSAAEIKRLTINYALSGIKDDPPQHLYKQFSKHYVVCSELIRSKETAMKLGINQIDLADNIFSEADLPHFDKSIIKMPAAAWVIILRIMWLLGFNKNGESFVEAKKRAKEATSVLMQLAEENKKVILVGHGLMNRLIAKQLRLNKWQGPTSSGKRYWEYARYTQ